MIGATIGHHRLLEKLGEGGMGEVYKAEDTQLKRLVAIKVMRRGPRDDEQGRLRFLQEARAASALTHPNIVQVYEFGSHDGEDFIAMEYVQGKTLAHLLHERRLTLDEVLDWGGQLAAALGAAHAAGIVHRDIKPANMIVTADGVVKVLDFGLARLDRLSAGIESTMTQGPVTQSEMVMGTAPYMSPEQAEGKTVDARSDLFSAGAVLYEMLAGRRAFDGSSGAAILGKVLRDSPAPLRGLRPDVPRSVEEIVDRCLRKDAAARYATGAELARDLAACRRPSAVAAPFRKPTAMLALAGFVLATALAGWFYVRHSRARWVHTEALPQIRRLIVNGDAVEAFELTRSALALAPDDLDLKSHWREVAMSVKLGTTPPGARISYRAYGEVAKPWNELAATPLLGVEIPNTYLQFRVEQQGMESLEFAAFSLHLSGVNLVLTSVGQLPEGMVPVPPGPQWSPPPPMPLADYFLDKFEVTNTKFQRFIDAGGYRDPKYWRQPLADRAKLFRDATGRPGPATWELGTFPKGQADFPVSGVSWFEAAAYCEYEGKSLPTEHHWRRAAGFGLYSTILAYSNFSNKGPARVGANPGISPFGAYDMAGNVKEWVWNQAPGGKRGILGGGWSETSYMFRDPDAQDPITREPLYGFRCAKYPSPVPAEALAPTPPPTGDFSKATPVDGKTFEIYRSMYAYDKTPLDTRIEMREDSAEDWTREKVSYRTVYGERMTASLYLPKRGQPPYQAIIWAPGGYAQMLPSSEATIWREQFLYLVRTGRAVLYPVYQGTYDRRNLTRGPSANRDARIQSVKDVFQSVDFLESRPEIDKSRIAFYGTSLGAYIGSFAMALEPRLKTGLLVAHGLSNASPPELDPLNFVPRIKAPVIMINGRQDFFYSYETSQQPMFRLLGAPDADKRHAVFEGGHVPPMRDTMREALAWLDKYLGPVEPQAR